jgi:hypothetical protein
MPTANVTTAAMESRRTFLRHTLAAGAGVTVAALASGTVLAVADADADKPEKTTKQGYRLTQHIAAYYQSASL